MAAHAAHASPFRRHLIVVTAALRFVGTASATTTPLGRCLRAPRLRPQPHRTNSSQSRFRAPRRHPVSSEGSHDDTTRALCQISEADVDANVVLVFKIVGRGTTSLVFALTRGDTSPSAVKATTHTVISR